MHRKERMKSNLRHWGNLNEVLKKGNHSDRELVKEMNDFVDCTVPVLSLVVLLDTPSN